TRALLSYRPSSQLSGGTVLSLLSYLACKLISKPYYITILMYMIIILSY
ncbi:unnamed protein product, partial [Callosobruchus maculatus]